MCIHAKDMPVASRYKILAYIPIFIHKKIVSCLHARHIKLAYIYFGIVISVNEVMLLKYLRVL